MKTELICTEHEPTLTILNCVGKARWRNDGAGSVLTVEIAKQSRKLRRAMTSRRWEKKMVKAVNAAMGYAALIAVTRHDQRRWRVTAPLLLEENHEP
ncbi:MAG: hypothetical protein JOZ62_00950 [Acidobacteriaceae bacterium]|nr:hypothetical protein [Acidobacteriaceae bacterium]